MVTAVEVADEPVSLTKKNVKVMLLPLLEPTVAILKLASSGKSFKGNLYQSPELVEKFTCI